MKLSVSFRQGLKSLAAFSVTWKKKIKLEQLSIFRRKGLKTKIDRLSILSQILTPAWD